MFLVGSGWVKFVLFHPYLVLVFCPVAKTPFPPLFQFLFGRECGFTFFLFRTHKIFLYLVNFQDSPIFAILYVSSVGCIQSLTKNKIVMVRPGGFIF